MEHQASSGSPVFQTTSFPHCVVANLFPLTVRINHIREHSHSPLSVGSLAQRALGDHKAISTFSLMECCVPWWKHSFLGRIRSLHPQSPKSQPLGSGNFTGKSLGITVRELHLFPSLDYRTRESRLWEKH